MFCYQCEETVNGKGCTVQGVCGKTNEISNLQDMLIYVLRGISVYAHKLNEFGATIKKPNKFMLDSLFSTITNANFDKDFFIEHIVQAFKEKKILKDALDVACKEKEGKCFEGSLPDMATWESTDEKEILEKAKDVGPHATEDEDLRSLRWLLIYGIKGIAAYAHHAYVLGKEDSTVYDFIYEGLAATTIELPSTDDLVALNMKCGEVGITTMALLDGANTETYGHPQPTHVKLGVGKNPAILISGHDLLDLKELLEQTKGTGVDVYTHGEMLPAHYYPELKKYDNLIGNYGGSWWKQKEEFESFNGPVLLTSNCLVPPKETYKDRIYTTGTVGFEGCTHIDDRIDGKPKDFTELIEHAKKTNPPTQIEEGEIVGGFAHNTVLSIADKVIDAVKAGKIKRFFVMAGCDGRHASRDYYTEFAKTIPKETIILTAGCAKYRYNKLDLGDIDGIPRVLDAGQCNDCYSLVVIAKALAEAFGMKDINELPISYNIAWYEQKAVLVLLALLHLGVKNIRLGPTLPAFISPNILDFLVKTFNIAPNTTVDDDIKALM